MNKKFLQFAGWFFFGSFIFSLLKGVTVAGALVGVSAAICLSSAYHNARHSFITFAGSAALTLGLFMVFHTVKDFNYSKGYLDGIWNTTTLGSSNTARGLTKAEQNMAAAVSGAIEIQPLKESKSEDQEKEANYRKMFEEALEEKPQIQAEILKQCLKTYILNTLFTSINGRGYELELLALQMSNAQGLDGNASFSVMFKNGLQAPEMKTVSGTLTYKLELLKSWEDKQDCAPKHYPYKVLISNLNLP
ncbi:hypothetical protein [Acinetobacter variabilis]|uniref:hypothetical protein n=1 Tax=Acinetobacter variabilis TaxID=70346 RepID=UPI0028AFD6BE|nr:hypothetical protein [Acinetobacter variabilis]